MRLKYYLRGAGVGVLVTTLIFITVLAFNNASKPTTDDQIIADAMALGMVFPDQVETKAEDSGVIPVETVEKPDEQSEPDKTYEVAENSEGSIDDAQQLAQTLEEIKNLTDAAATEQANLDAQKAADSSEKKTEDVKTDTTAETKTDTKPEVKEDTKPETKTEENAVVTSTAEKIAFSVGGGDSSYDVAKNLVKQGLVQDALAYDRYLEQNGYDRKLKTGTFYLNTNMSEEDIAQVLIGKNRTTSPVQ